MTKTGVTFLVTVLALTVGAASGTAEADKGKKGGGHHGMPAAHDEGASKLHKHMMKSSSEMKSMKMTGDVDHDFVAMMKEHHRHGIEMAEIALQHGKDAKAKEFAQRIVAQQKKEIAELDSWLAQHKPAPGSAGDHGAHK